MRDHVSGAGGSPGTPTLRDVMSIMDRLYPPSLAADWDAVGLVCGLPSSPVRRILLTVDAGEEASMEAVDRGADLVISHHPLLLSGVTSVAAVNARGRVLHRLISHGISLFTAHTNADCARAGVSDALATALGVRGLQPLDPAADPAAAARGDGLGRVGTLDEPMALTDFAARVAAALPATARGISVSGPLMSPVSRVAVCGGSGDSLLAAADRAGADVFVTADLKHHRAHDHRAEGRSALIDVPHWASEWPWLAWCARDLGEQLRATPGGEEVDIIVSTECTDPWTAHYDSPEPE